MPALNSTATVSLQYTPPGSAANSGNVSYVVTASCQAQCVGQIDVSTSAAPGSTIEIPFGSVGDAKMIVLKNLGANEYGVRLNGSVTNTFSLVPNGEFVFAGSTIPSDTSISSLTVVVLSTPSSVDYLQYFVYGD